MSQEPNNPVKKPSRFDAFVAAVGKGVDQAGKSLNKAAMKGKELAFEKVLKVEASPEDGQINVAFERYKATKYEIANIAKYARTVYEARINEAHYHYELCQQMKLVTEDKKDPFSMFSRIMGNSLFSIEKVQEEHCQRMEQEFVIPFERFRDFDVEEVSSLKLKYRDIKAEYDLAVHNLGKANQSYDNAKIQEAKQKRDDRFNELTQFREQLKQAVANLEFKKNTELLPSLQKYWGSYASYCQSQGKIMQPSNIPSVDVSNYQYIPNPQFRANISKQNEENNNVNSDDENAQQPQYNNNDNNNDNNNNNSNNNNINVNTNYNNDNYNTNNNFSNNNYPNNNFNNNDNNNNNYNYNFVNEN